MSIFVLLCRECVERELAKEYRENLHTLQTIFENEETEKEKEKEKEKEETRPRYTDPKRQSVVLSAQDIASSILSRSKKPPPSRSKEERSTTLRKQQRRK
jgi:hypothetical protein